MDFLDNEINDSGIEVISKILQELSKINHKFNIKNIKFNHKKAELLIKKNTSNHKRTILVDYDFEQENIENLKKNILIKKSQIKQNINLPLITYRNNKKICDCGNKLNYLTNNIPTDVKSMFKKSYKSKPFSFDHIINENNSKKQLDSYFNSFRSSLLDFANVSYHNLDETCLKLNTDLYFTHKIKQYNYNIKNDTIVSLSNQDFEESFNIID